MRSFRLTEPQRFGIRFFSILLLMSALAWAVGITKQLGAYQRLLAAAATSLAQLVGSTSWAEADQISANGVTLDINYECTGVYVLLILFTFLLAYPAAWWSRLLGFLVGTVALSAVNVLRIAVLVRVAELQPDLFGYFHEYVWQGIFLVLVIAYAMVWVDRVR